MSILYASKEEFHIPHSTFNIEFFAPQKTLGGYCGGVPPLPIPNREVKPACADGTAMQCGRVGGCLLYFRSSESNDFGDLFFVPIGEYCILQGVQRSPLHQPSNPVLVCIAACKTSVAEVSGLRSTRSNLFLIDIIACCGGRRPPLRMML